ncbi:hypothetical protein K438DRAFT_306116 [Mycena galopus ATCC 62051]|nr:hypothetical protein K438DRAFT_306116 [Mycena galopus ATCC 62051]
MTNDNGAPSSAIVNPGSYEHSFDPVVTQVSNSESVDPVIQALLATNPLPTLPQPDLPQFEAPIQISPQAPILSLDLQAPTVVGEPDNDLFGPRSPSVWSIAPPSRPLSRVTERTECRSPPVLSSEAPTCILPSLPIVVPSRRSRSRSSRSSSSRSSPRVATIPSRSVDSRSSGSSSASSRRSRSPILRILQGHIATGPPVPITLPPAPSIEPMCVYGRRAHIPSRSRSRSRSPPRTHAPFRSSRSPPRTQAPSRSSRSPPRRYCRSPDPPTTVLPHIPPRSRSSSRSSCSYRRYPSPPPITSPPIRVPCAPPIYIPTDRTPSRSRSVSRSRSRSRSHFTQPPTIVIPPQQVVVSRPDVIDRRCRSPSRHSPQPIIVQQPEVAQPPTFASGCSFPLNGMPNYIPNGLPPSHPPQISRQNFSALTERAQNLKNIITNQESQLVQLTNQRTRIGEPAFMEQVRTVSADLKNRKEHYARLVTFLHQVQNIAQVNGDQMNNMGSMGISTSPPANQQPWMQAGWPPQPQPPIVIQLQQPVIANDTPTNIPPTGMIQHQLRGAMFGGGPPPAPGMNVGIPPPGMQLHLMDGQQPQQPQQPGLTRPTREHLQAAMLHIAKLKQDYSPERMLANVPAIDVPAEQRMEYNNVLEQLYRACKDLDCKLPMLLAILKKEDVVRRLVIIIQTAIQERAMIFSGSSRFLVTLETLRTMLQQVRDMIESFATIMASVTAHDGPTTTIPPRSQPPIIIQAPRSPSPRPPIIIQAPRSPNPQPPIIIQAPPRPISPVTDHRSWSPTVIIHSRSRSPRRSPRRRSRSRSPRSDPYQRSHLPMPVVIQPTIIPATSHRGSRSRSRSRSRSPPRGLVCGNANLARNRSPTIYQPQHPVIIRDRSHSRSHSRASGRRLSRSPSRADIYISRDESRSHNRSRSRSRTPHPGARSREYRENTRSPSRSPSRAHRIIPRRPRPRSRSRSPVYQEINRAGRGTIFISPRRSRSRTPVPFSVPRTFSPRSRSRSRSPRSRSRSPRSRSRSPRHYPRLSPIPVVVSPSLFPAAQTPGPIPGQPSQDNRATVIALTERAQTLKNIIADQESQLDQLTNQLDCIGDASFMQEVREISENLKNKKEHYARTVEFLHRIENQEQADGNQIFLGTILPPSLPSLTLALSQVSFKLDLLPSQLLLGAMGSLIHL